MSFSVESPYRCLGEEWSVGSVHNHTISSKYTPVSPTRAIELAAAAGLGFFAITEHDRRSLQLPWSDSEWQAAEYVADCRLLRGFEASFPDDHVNCLGVLPDQLAGCPGDAGYLGQVVERGGVCVLNHPAQWNDDPGRVLALTDGECLHGLEVYSGSRATGDKTTRTDPGVATKLWDALLSRGRRLWAFASADCHSYDAANPDYFTNGVVVVNCTGGDPADVMPTLREGRFYASSGLRVDHVEVTDEHYTVAAREAVAIRFLGRGGTQLRHSASQGAEYRFTGDESYVRCEVIGAASSHPASSFPQSAWLQPAFVAADS